MAEIALKVGSSALSQFTTAFRRVVAAPPGARRPHARLEVEPVDLSQIGAQS